MGSNEEYLDNLLKSLSTEDDKAENSAQNMGEAIHEETDQSTPDIDSISIDDIDTMPLFSDTEKGDFFAGLGLEESQEPWEEEAALGVKDIGKNDNKAIEVENTQDMLSDEIDALLSASMQMETADAEDEISPFGDAVGDGERDADLSEINELLMKSDNNEPVSNDMIALLEGIANKEENADSQEEADEEPETKKEKRKRRREKKKKDKGEQSEGVEELFSGMEEDLQLEESDENKQIKKSFLRKLIEFLTAEEEAEEAVLDENQAILQELAEEDKAALDKKNKKAAKAKKGKKGKEADLELEEDEDTGKATGKGKKTKPSKPKKPKKVEQEEDNEKPGKKLAKKSIIVVACFGATILAGLLIVNYFISDMLIKSTAQKAFSEKDYAACFEALYGIKRDEGEEMMLNHARVIIKMQRRIEVYNQYMGQNKELEAIDSLMKAVAGYDELYGIAQKWNAASEVELSYRQILGILSDRYSLTEEQVREIALCVRNVDYTRYLTALVEGKGFQDAVQGTDMSPVETLPNELPEESELAVSNFVE